MIIVLHAKTINDLSPFSFENVTFVLALEPQRVPTALPSIRDRTECVGGISVPRGLLVNNRAPARMTRTYNGLQRGGGLF